jgi:hypothetical protein
MLKMYRIPLAIWSALAACMLLVGCGDDRPLRVPVSGKVLIDGKPLTHGFVRFIPSGARPSGGKLDEQGHFKLSCFEGEDGAVPGKHRVEIAANEALSSTKVRWHAPKKYNDLGTSGITQEISGPTDSVVINLSWHGGAPFVETVATEF